MIYWRTNTGMNGVNPYANKSETNASYRGQYQRVCSSIIETQSTMPISDWWKQQCVKYMMPAQYDSLCAYYAYKLSPFKVQTPAGRERERRDRSKSYFFVPFAENRPKCFSVVGLFLQIFIQQREHERQKGHARPQRSSPDWTSCYMIH